MSAGDKRTPSCVFRLCGLCGCLGVCVVLLYPGWGLAAPIEKVACASGAASPFHLVFVHRLGKRELGRCLGERLLRSVLSPTFCQRAHGIENAQSETSIA